jgi:hypothetical protein
MEDKGHCVITVVGQDGHNYFQADLDRGKGDRRSDGKLNADFFGVEVASMTTDNVRVSHRLAKRGRDNHEEESGLKALETGPVEMTELEAPTMSMNTPRVQRVPRVPRVPDACIKCAVRKRTARLLWLHEFYIVYGNKRKKKNPYVYQAIQFVIGAELPFGVVQGMSARHLREIWVLGVWYVPAERVRKYSKRQKGYMFHTELNDDDADKALYGTCPEVVRVENCLRWHPMSRVESSVPRVVHANDVKKRRIVVAGREMHYVCGVTATEDVSCQEFKLSLLPRESFTMYPEERLGLEVNSPSMMWEAVDDVFTKIRQCMSSARQGTSSASFKMPFLLSNYVFWKVSITISFGLLISNHALGNCRHS